MSVIIRLLFVDLAGVLRGMEKIVNEPNGVYAFFDASSVFGFEEIENSDLMIKCIDETLFEVPWAEGLFACLSTIHYPDGSRYFKDPRLVAEKLAELLYNLRYEALMGAEIEFFLVRGVRADISMDKQMLAIDVPEAPWKNGGIPLRQGYFIVEPIDEIAFLRKKIIEYSSKVGLKIVKSHHEVATAGQIEITSSAYGPIELGDFIVLFKNIARTVASQHGYKALFLPKPFPGDNGSGMHIHVSLWRDGRNIFYDPVNPYKLSQEARYFIGGILEHGRSLSAIVSPTVNSYRRLVPGYEAPTLLAWGLGNRSVAVRVPRISEEKSLRIEYRPPDPLANPYLAVSAVILAGLDGIRKKIEPPPPLTSNAYKLTEQEIRELGISSLPRSLDEALDELEIDHDYLKPVFSREIIDSYIELKRREVRRQQPIPAPQEYVEYMYW